MPSPLTRERYAALKDLGFDDYIKYKEEKPSSSSSSENYNKEDRRNSLTSFTRRASGGSSGSIGLDSISEADKTGSNLALESFSQLGDILALVSDNTEHR